MSYLGTLSFLILPCCYLSTEAFVCFNTLIINIYFFHIVFKNMVGNLWIRLHIMLHSLDFIDKDNMFSINGSYSREVYNIFPVLIHGIVSLSIIHNVHSQTDKLQFCSRCQGAKFKNILSGLVLLKGFPWGMGLSFGHEK